MHTLLLTPRTQPHLRLSKPGYASKLHNRAHSNKRNNSSSAVSSLTELSVLNLYFQEETCSAIKTPQPVYLKPPTRDRIVLRPLRRFPADQDMHSWQAAKHIKPGMQQGQNRARKRVRSGALRIPKLFKRVFTPVDCLHSHSTTEYPRPDVCYEQKGSRDVAIPDTQSRVPHSTPCHVTSRSSTFCASPGSPWSNMHAFTVRQRFASNDDMLWPVLCRPAAKSRTNSNDLGFATSNGSEATFSSLYPQDDSQSGEACKPSQAHEQLSKSAISARATAQANLMQSQLERDIEAFLRSPFQIETLDAKSIIALCEAAEDLNCCLSKSSRLSSHRALSPAKRVSRCGTQGPSEAKIASPPEFHRPRWTQIACS